MISNPLRFTKSVLLPIVMFLSFGFTLLLVFLYGRDDSRSGILYDISYYCAYDKIKTYTIFNVGIWIYSLIAIAAILSRTWTMLILGVNKTLLKFEILFTFLSLIFIIIMARTNGTMDNQTCHFTSAIIGFFCNVVMLILDQVAVISIFKCKTVKIEVSMVFVLMVIAATMWALWISSEGEFSMGEWIGVIAQMVCVLIWPFQNVRCDKKLETKLHDNETFLVFVN